MIGLCTYNSILCEACAEAQESFIVKTAFILSEIQTVPEQLNIEHQLCWTQSVLCKVSAHTEATAEHSVISCKHEVLVFRRYS